MARLSAPGPSNRCRSWRCRAGPPFWQQVPQRRQAGLVGSASVFNILVACAAVFGLSNGQSSGTAAYPGAGRKATRRGGRRRPPWNGYCLPESVFFRIYVDKDGGFSVTEQQSCAGLGRGGIYPANSFSRRLARWRKGIRPMVRAPAGKGWMVLGVWQHLKSNNGG